MITVTHGSLFSGYGGLDLAIEEVLGARTAWVSDIDPGACKVLAHRYPDVPNLGDITAIDWASVDPVDIISGGSPCPDLSTAGRRAGMHPGTRSGLWESMREAIAVLRPALVIWENVRGAYSASAHSDLEYCPGCMGDPTNRGAVLRALGRVLGDLSDLGYDAVWVGLRAADVGAPHGRFRVFVIAADTRSESRLEWGLAAPGQAPGRGPLGEPSGHDRAPLALLPTPSAGAFNDTEDLDQWEARRQRVAQTAANGNGFGTPLGVAVRLLNRKDGNEEDGPGEALRELPSEAALARGSRRANGVDFGPYEAAVQRWEAVLGRDAPQPTKRGKHGNPRLNPEFASWMMGCPDGWVTDVPGITRNEALRLAGNGVVPQQAAAALRYALPLLQERAS